MKVLHDCSDERLQTTCVYCGGPPETQDHVPSKFLLDDPFPDNLPKVSACRNCNNGFSLDEEYFGCFIEVVLRGSADPALEMRPKVQNALTHNPRLAAMIESKRDTNENGIWWEPDLERIERVVYKLAQGHAAYEYSAPVLDKPEILIFQPLLLISDQQRTGFETPQASILWPEVG